MTGRPKNRKNTKPQHMWSKEEIEYLTQITPGRYRKEILKLMNEKFEYQFSLTQIAAAIKRRNTKGTCNYICRWRQK